MTPDEEILESLQQARNDAPIGVYRHRSGREYVVYNHSMAEHTQSLLVHCYSLESGISWTRTVRDFIEEVEGKPRFVFVRKVTRKELEKPYFATVKGASQEEREDRIICGDAGAVCYQCKRAVTEDTAMHGVGAGWVCRDKALCTAARNAREAQIRAKQGFGGAEVYYRSSIFGK
jgi:hypothetical protein